MAEGAEMFGDVAEEKQLQKKAKKESYIRCVFFLNVLFLPLPPKHTNTPHFRVADSRISPPNTPCSPAPRALPEAEVDEGQKRKATSKIIKNRGLVAHRKVLSLFFCHVCCNSFTCVGASVFSVL